MPKENLNSTIASYKVDITKENLNPTIASQRADIEMKFCNHLIKKVLI